LKLLAFSFRVRTPCDFLILIKIWGRHDWHSYIIQLVWSPFLLGNFARGIVRDIIQFISSGLSSVCIIRSFHYTTISWELEPLCCGIIHLPHAQQDINPDPTALALVARVTILKALFEALSHSISTVQLIAYDRDNIVIRLLGELGEPRLMRSIITLSALVTSRFSCFLVACPARLCTTQDPSSRTGPISGRRHVIVPTHPSGCCPFRNSCGTCLLSRRT
jgi:hypothetical protein